MIEYHAHNAKAQGSDDKGNNIVPFFLVLALTGFLFVQQVYELDFINPANIPRSHKKKRNGKE